MKTLEEIVNDIKKITTVYDKYTKRLYIKDIETELDLEDRKEYKLIDYNTLIEALKSYKLGE